MGILNPGGTSWWRGSDGRASAKGGGGGASSTGRCSGHEGEERGVELSAVKMAGGVGAPFIGPEGREGIGRREAVMAINGRPFRLEGETEGRGTEGPRRRRGGGAVSGRGGGIGAAAARAGGGGGGARWRRPEEEEGRLADRVGPPVSEWRWRSRLGRTGGRRWAGGREEMGRWLGPAGWAEFASRAEIQRNKRKSI